MLTYGEEIKLNKSYKYTHYCKSYLSYLLNQVVILLTYYDLNPRKVIVLNIPFQLVTQLNCYMINPKHIQHFRF